MKYLIGIAVIAFGFLLMWKTNWFLDFVGRIDWAEQHLGSEGGSRLLIKIIGLLLIIGTFLALTGVLQGMLGGIFRSGALGGAEQ